MSQSESFSELLRNYRRSQGWTQSRLAKTFGFSPETISAWERGKRVPNSQEIPHLADLLSMRSEELMMSIDATRVQTNGRTNAERVTDGPKPERKNEKAVDSRRELLHIYRDRTELSREYSYPRLFENAHDILAVGISLNAIAMTYSKENIIKLITEQKCTITLCFLNPDGIGCAQREREEDLPTGWLSSLIRLNISTMHSILNHINKLAPDCAQQLKIMTYDLLPRYNVYLIDDTHMIVQSYGYGCGEDTPTFVFRRQSSRGLFDYYASAARHILQQATITNIQSESIKEIER